LDPTLASLGDRLIGELLDAAIDAVILILWVLPFALAGPVGPNVMPSGLLFGLVYVLFADGLPGGQSLGKRINNTAVVDARTGEPCTFGQSFVRNAILTILGVIDWVFIFGKKRQRLGDKAAHTIVVRVARGDEVTR
jgi:uncharacterized RDD family membrane protein YckC